MEESSKKEETRGQLRDEIEGLNTVMEELEVLEAVDIAEEAATLVEETAEAVEAQAEQLEAEYEAYADECQAAMDLTMGRIRFLCKTIDRSGGRNPFDRIESRIKTFKSVKGKCRERGYPCNMQGIRENVRDVAGIRIITKYIDEIDLVKNMIIQMPGVNVVSIKDYVTNPKPNGYQSVHLSCQIEVYDAINGSRLVPLEIQLRSKSMNLWATLEHDLKYKNENPSPEVDEKFRRIGMILREFDEEAIALRDYGEVEVSNKAAATSVSEKLRDLTVSR
ncbi:hypothetical protein IKF23_03965 [Candidatus Saccharibacteria bacterium]|nr:hypothetical protein [Candidatus Saccharibacteria bacterium]